METGKLLKSLNEQTQLLIQQAEILNSYDLFELKWKENQDSWNILECLEHLNLYSNFYLPQIEEKIKCAKTSKAPVFKTGFLGNYFAQSMLPKESLKKMKTFKDKNPINNTLDKTVIDNYIKNHFWFLALLDKAEKVSLNKVRIATSFSKLIQLKLGDTFRFLVNHHLRHLAQIERIKTAMEKNIPKNYLKHNPDSFLPIK